MGVGLWEWGCGTVPHTAIRDEGALQGIGHSGPRRRLASAGSGDIVGTWLLACACVRACCTLRPRSSPARATATSHATRRTCREQQPAGKRHDAQHRARHHHRQTKEWPLSHTQRVPEDTAGACDTDFLSLVSLCIFWIFRIVPWCKTYCGSYVGLSYVGLNARKLSTSQ